MNDFTSVSYVVEEDALIFLRRLALPHGDVEARHA
jgi:hypothetical protein